jgi:hypothetical protein
MASEFVLLECVKEGSKLRVKMKSPGYLINSNCQFPRDLRVDGRKFKVPVAYVKLMTQQGKYFYSIKNKSVIEIITDEEKQQINLENIKQNTKIYEDASTMECAVCLCAEKDTVFIPCGHFYTCNGCSQQLKTCPICRTTITDRINKSMFD